LGEDRRRSLHRCTHCMHCSSLQCNALQCRTTGGGAIVQRCNNRPPHRPARWAACPQCSGSSGAGSTGSTPGPRGSARGSTGVHERVHSPWTPAKSLAFQGIGRVAGGGVHEGVEEFTGCQNPSPSRGPRGPRGRPSEPLVQMPVGCTLLDKRPPFEKRGPPLLDAGRGLPRGSPPHGTYLFVRPGPVLIR
jgi:hypothetical protein